MSEMEEVTPRSPAEYFDENKYVLLEGVIGKEFCKELTKRMFSLCEDGLMLKDDQCPKSDAIYGDEVFDALLEKLAEPIGNHVNKKLIPTYTYARIYRPGEVLERHTDRPACEISGTMTLGHDGINVWPIYLTDDPTDDEGKRVDLSIGDILMYRGEDLAHWRPAFKGEWQCQVFFHYVDADGPHADKEKFDGRPKLGLPSTAKGTELPETEKTSRPIPEPASAEQQSLKNRLEEELPDEGVGVFPIFGGVMIPSWDLNVPGVCAIDRHNYGNIAFTDEECDRIIALASDAYADKGSIGSGNEGKVNTQIRNVNLYRVPLIDDTKWVFERISRAVSIANHNYYQFEIMGITHELQLLHYESGDKPGHYNWHMDIGGMQSATRKISVSVQLSDSEEYTGGELTVNANGQDVTGTKERGTMTMFPSYCMHRVAPMQSGERWALVIWVHGSQRFK